MNQTTEELQQLLQEVKNKPWGIIRMEKRGNEMIKKLIRIVIIFLLTSCSIPETKVYNLHVQADKGTITQRGGASIVILMDAKRYLTQPYIVYRSSPYQMEISRYSKWESSPKLMVKRALKDSMFSTGLFKDVKTLNIVPEGFHVLAVNLKRFERLDEGSESFGELDFEFSFISPEGKELYRDRITKKVDLDDKSFLSLAKGLSNALDEAIKEVRTNIVNAF